MPKVRYAVVGLGHISQVAVLPAFKHAKENSELAALVSSDQKKLKELGRRYRISELYDYDRYGECLKSGMIDAVYLGLPNDLHREYAIKAAEAGIHILTEKPMGVSSKDCEEMLAAANANGVKLMVAYRLHFEEANLRAIQAVESGKIGNPRIFSSVFSQNVTDKDNIRLKRERGGGTLFDMGIYCINAARYLFQSEPEEVIAFCANSGDERFNEVDEMTSAVLRFPGDRLASFTSSFGAVDESSYEVVGTKGKIKLSPAYEYAIPLSYEMTTVGKSGREKTVKHKLPKRDQFGPELLYFSDCILTNREPEPSGIEGLADLKIIEALYESAETKKAVKLTNLKEPAHPQPSQEIKRPGVKKPEEVHATSPSGE